MDCSLRNLWLIRRISSEEFPARNQRVDHDGSVVRVRSGAEECREALSVLGRAVAEELDDLAFSIGARDPEVAGKPIFLGNRSKQGDDRVDTDVVQHFLAV